MMNKIKVQFIGIKNIPSKEDDEIFRVRKIKWLISGEGYSSAEDLSFHDYNIVFINYPFKIPYPTEPTGFLKYISGGGIAVIFLGPSDYYPWGNTRLLEMSISKGDTITPNPKHWLKEIFKNYRFTWFCMIEPDEILLIEQSLKNLASLAEKSLSTENIFEVTGTTVSGRSVSAVIHYRSGKLILLPIPENPTKMSVDLIRDLLVGIKNNYLKKEEIPEPKPEWVEKQNLQPELKLKDEMDTIVGKFREIKQKLEWYESIKKILYSQGKELSSSVYLIFKEMGFGAELKEDEGRQDIELKFNSFFAIVETKGLKEYAKIRDLRQLLHYYVSTKEKHPNVKGIFIVNHFRNKDFSERDVPYSKDALELAENNGFCLLTTIDLFKLYDLFLDGKITMNQMIDLFQNTKGLMQW